VKILLIVIGKTDESYLQEGVAEYITRIGKYLPFEMLVLPDIKQRKTFNIAQQKQIEGEKILSVISAADHLVLLDENGKQFNSRSFALYVQKHMNAGLKRLIFVVGGPYGFSEEVYQRANGKLSLSAMTFSHQMVRLVFAEQLYRAMTILRNEPYHHD
jgi:23S rRNA (pseudouridine1915-N3)-methyltransferase